MKKRSKAIKERPLFFILLLPLPRRENMHQLQVKQQLHSHKIRRTYKHSSFLRVIILTQATQFKTHTMAYVQNQKQQTRKDKRKRFCAKVVKMFEFAKENIEFG